MYQSFARILPYTISKNISRYSSNMPGIELNEVVKHLNDFASIKLAEKWDNVGLLIEPFTPKLVQNILLTNDLTEAVMKEVISKKVDFIISYHPPIFAPLKRITQDSWKERIVAQCLENRIALYSPHTAWDCIKGGVNDWLVKFLPIEESLPITPIVDNPEYGAGRICKLSTKLTLGDIINNIKQHIGINKVQVSIANNGDFNSEVGTVAVCAGSGGSVLKYVKADLFITGEMSHHEVLEAVHNKSHVILTNHSNSERGFLKEFKQILKASLNNPDMKIFLSESDADPLKAY